jgi:processive 1,2-diacylglycerol beta-glucosyltransferase
VRTTILILTAGFGEGHNTAARSIAKAIEREPDTRALVVDLFSDTHPIIGQILRSGYLFCITHLPGLWQRLYRLAERFEFARDGQPAFNLLAEHLEDLVHRHRPDAIVATYPIYTHLVRHLRSRGVELPPLITVVTDSISINRVWVTAPSHAYLVPDPDTARRLGEMGVPPEKITVTGFPVDPSFAELAGLPGPRPFPPSILYLPSTRRYRVRRTLNRLVPFLEGGASLTVVMGHHAGRLHSTLRRFIEDHPAADIEAVGWSNRIPELLHRSHLVIAKAGGATANEALSAACPLVIEAVVPGQEEGNAQRLVDIGGAIRPARARAIADAVAQIIDPSTRLHHSMRQKMLAAGRPDAALTCAHLILDLSSNPPAHPR